MQDNRQNVAGLRIKMLRQVSQRAFAELLQLYGLDLTKNTVQQIEAGKRRVYDQELIVIAAVFEVGVEELLR